MSTLVSTNAAPSESPAHSSVSLHPLGWLREFRQHQFLISQLTRREVVGRYRGSHLGMFWTFINPLLLLCVYTVVFKYIFRAKFTGHPDEGWADFALMLFSALIVFNLFAECLARAPSLMLVNANYVTKVVFPLEMLPLTVVLGSLVHLLIGFIPLCLAAFITRNGHLHGAALLWPLLLVPITFWALGMTWLVSALGAFVRDLNEIMIALTQILMYASAVFYPISKVQPLALQKVIRLNPLAFFSEQSRNLIVWGEPMNWSAYGWVTLSGAIAMIVGYKVFMNVKPAFADVI
jgi:lipopolysaccharide transport system permease protein